MIGVVGKPKVVKKNFEMIRNGRENEDLHIINAKNVLRKVNIVI